MTPHSVGRCPKDRGDRLPLGEPFFKRVFLNNTCEFSMRILLLYAVFIYRNRRENGGIRCRCDTKRFY